MSGNTEGSTPAQPSSISGDTTPCQNETGLTYSVTNVPSVTYTWDYSGTGENITAGQDTNIITVNYAASANSGTWTVTPSNVCGNGTARTLTVIMELLPAQPSEISGNETPCQGATSLTYLVTNIPGVTYAWDYSGTGETITAGQGTNSITVNYSDSATSGTWTVTPSNVCGNGTARTLAMTMGAVPEQPSAISGNATPCEGDTGVTYSVTNVAAVTFTWSYSGTGETITAGQETNSITVNYSGSATSGTWTVTPSNECGSGIARTLLITMKTVPAQPNSIIGNETPCLGTTGLTYSVTNVPGVTYTWEYSGIGDTITAGQGTNSVTVNYSGSATSGTWTVTPSTICGNGTARTFPITMKTIPAQPSSISGNETPCLGTTGLTYSVTNVPGVTYAWDYSGTGETITAGQDANSITVNYSGSATSGTWTVTPSNTCGNGTARTLSTTMRTVPAQPSSISGDTTPCQAETGLTYPVTNVPGVTYNWDYSGNGETITSGQGTNSITVNFSAFATSGTWTVTPSNECGNGTARTLLISMELLPAQPSTISGNTTPRQGTTDENYSVTNVSDVSYAWSYGGAGETIITGQGTNSITADYSCSAISGTWTVTPSNTCGNGAARTLEVTMDLPISHSYSQCDSGDVYWFDYCGTREEVISFCCDATCTGTACDSGACSSHGDCNTDTDVCVCQTEFSGPTCSQCDVGYDSYPSCAPMCSITVDSPHDAGTGSVASIAYNGSGYGISYSRFDSNLYTYFAKLDASGSLIGGTEKKISPGTTWCGGPDIAWADGSSRYGTIFQCDDDIYFSCLDVNGNVVGVQQIITSGGSVTEYPRIVSDGSFFGIVWSEDYIVYFVRFSANSCTPNPIATRTVSSGNATDPDVVATDDFTWGVVWHLRDPLI